MKQIEQYGRIQIDFDIKKAVDKVRYTTPEGNVEEGPAFKDMPAKLVYDYHGYETVEQIGDIRLSSRFTPVEIGTYTWKAYSEDILVEEGEFECIKGKNTGHVKVSEKDSRYFAYTNGDSYVPIGLNLVGADYYVLATGGDHFERSKQSATPGCITYERWMKELSENGGNYARLWLSSRYFEARTETPGVHDLNAFIHLDNVVEIARKYGIRLKMCLEHFRTFTKTDSYFHRMLKDPETGGQMKDIEQWYNDPKWNKIWLEDIASYLARYWNDPVVFAWELWNENDCGDGKFDSVLKWTERMLREIKKCCPKNLVTNSLGSFDEIWKQKVQDAFRDLEEMDFQQVHRYLDQGAPWEIVREDAVLFSIDAVTRSRCEDKPIILTETGAVNDRHTGPFRFYQCDHKGLIFHDVTYPAFFAGAAGSGHIWHWTEYVEAKNLWKYFKPFSSMLNGVKVDEEDFKTVNYSTEGCWILALEGRKHTLIFMRNKTDRWDYVLRDNIEPTPIEDITLPISEAVEAKVYWLCDDNGEEICIADGKLNIPKFYHGCVIRVKKGIK